MELHGPPYHQAQYFVRYKSPSGRSIKRTSWRMTSERAAQYFAGKWYELIEAEKMIVVYPVDPFHSHFSHINTGMLMPPKSD